MSLHGTMAYAFLRQVFKISLNFYLCVSIWHPYMCVHLMYTVPEKIQKGVLNSLEMELKMVVSCRVACQEQNPGPLEERLNHWAISPVPKLIFFVCSFLHLFPVPLFSLQLPLTPSSPALPPFLLFLRLCTPHVACCL